ncbi:MAG: hypothetical protein LBT47_12895 [Deltaproteobacteria bacterium]|jgi:hypothetical protein|nr:hypothetical protein [Deltaproteobacteria bacterium]
MANTGYDISRNEDEINATLKASDPYGLVQASILAMGALLTNRDMSGQYWESSCLNLAGTSRSELLARLWSELLYYLRHEQLNLVKANVAEFSETKLVVECFFSSDFTPGTLLLGPEWLNGTVTVPLCSEFKGNWVAHIVWKAADSPNA